MIALKNGIDVSEWDFLISWDRVKTDFAIIRLGFGTNQDSHHDKYFEKNVNGCIENNIPFGVYIFSYANSWDKLYSEIEHAKVQITKFDSIAKPFAVFIDMEDKSTVEVGKNTLTEYALEFCKQITAAGYRAGVYANQNWFQNYIDVARISEAGYVIWCAKYSNNPPSIATKYDIWQYTSSGRVEGIEGDVDLNHMYTELFDNEELAATKHKTVDELAAEVLSGFWGNGLERKVRLGAAGYDYYQVQNKVNELLGIQDSLTSLAYQVIRGDWGNGTERKNRLTAAGYDYTEVQKRVNQLLGIVK